jgi:Ca-activated chloride channel family protein
MLMLTALVYSTLNVTDGLTFQTVKSQAVVDAMRQLELHTYHYGEQSRALLELMARRGTSYLHASTSTEAETLKYNAEHGAALRYPFVFIFPAEGEYWTGQLYCILDAPWVSADQREAAQLYRDYLLAPEQQALANDYYLRPLDTSLPLDCPICLDSGTDPRANPQTVPDLGVPSTEASAAVKELFIETKKKATVVVVLDISGSMQGDKIKGATQATANFISRLYTDDYVMVIAFNNQMIELQPSGFKREVGDDLEGKVRNLPAEGGTALYDAVCQAVERVEALQAADEAAGDKRLYGIVVLSDGKDTASHKTENDMFNICLPSGEAVEGVKVFTIAYGEDAETDLLLRIANRTNGKSFAADPATIEKVYNSISAEQ